MLFNEPLPFEGLPKAGFKAFGIPDPTERRKAIIREFHPGLKALGDQAREALKPRSNRPFQIHLPRLDWPKGYRPFCTWVALSHMTHGYQSAPQLNVGVHPDHVSVRLGWDTSAASFLRFEFLWKHTDVADLLQAATEKSPLTIRVYGSAPWPQGSKVLFADPKDVQGSFRAVHGLGVWWELGLRFEIPQNMDKIGHSDFAGEVSACFGRVLPLCERLT